MEWTEKFTKWLSIGKEDADRLLDMPWDITVKEGSKEDIITATHPKIPLPLKIYVSKYFANLYMDPDVPTDAMTVEERMRAYKKLLYMNADLNLMKTSLVGEEQRVVLMVDLDLVCLNKSEFNDALAALSLGVRRVIDAFDLEAELSKQMFDRAVEMVCEKIKEHESKENIIDFLIHRVGMDEEYTEDFMKNIMSAMEEVVTEK